MKNIRMQYPVDPTGKNSAYDGRKHEIQPLDFCPIKIGGRDFYVMYYCEDGYDMVTLLTKIGSKFAKVPMDNYEPLYALLDTGKLARVAMDVGDEIVLAETLSAQAFCHGLDQNQNYFEHQNYVPLDVTGNNLQPGQSAFELSWIQSNLGEDSQTQRYQFQKSASYQLKDRKINEGLRMRAQTFDFQIKVPEGMTAENITTDKHGRAVAQVVYLIPGVHQYHVTYAKCHSNETFTNVAAAKEFAIDASATQYRDFHDQQQVFVDGCRGQLNLYVGDKNFSKGVENDFTLSR